MRAVIERARMTVPYGPGPSALAANNVARKARPVPSHNAAEALPALSHHSRVTQNGRPSSGGSISLIAHRRSPSASVASLPHTSAKDGIVHPRDQASHRRIPDDKI